ncbi:hypothetical protein KVR01_012009 [Diaporthe batatas]|uniref:uncharacterized protein n=1 Tax=Diaporthe batatas TaxID=748121 RepID=UPI001D051ED8|nr:uncharacterized protein KVR01_012009 [Diaporthe batatas]KAG8158248.1 hypothetical protein KVR01_012009 [Diaporthe batatas]
MAETISPDYLVIGAGAMGLAFVDTLITDTKATVAVVDRYGRPGGQWTLVYPFVRLHQPSEFYGVNSRELGEGKIDEVGPNKGMAEMATGDEVLAYFSKVMHSTLLPSGRVTYYPKHEWVGDGKFKSLITNKTISVGSNTKIVDATYMKVEVPAMKPPPYEVARDVSHIKINDLSKLSRPYGGYTVVGSGKTGIDACLWLMANGVDPKDITWIMPSDAWLFDRSRLQIHPEIVHQTAAKWSEVEDAILESSSVDDMFKRVEAAGELLRIDEKRWPTVWKCCTVSTAELEQIRRIENIVRKGRVARIDTDKVTLTKGTYEPVSDAIYIDCTSNAAKKVEQVPVFNGNHITLQPVRRCQQLFSAAFIAHVEATYGDEEDKNKLCRPIQAPNEPLDYLISVYQMNRNHARWAAEERTGTWLQGARLDMVRGIVQAIPEDVRAATMAEKMKKTELVTEKLRELLRTIPAEDLKRVEPQLVGW